MATATTQAANRGIRLEWMTIGWSCVEAAVALFAAWRAGSIALAGFGWDSAIEAASGGVLMWRLLAQDEEARRERAERISLKAVGGLFVALAGYVLWEGVEGLWAGRAPARSPEGIALALAACVAMPLLAREKRRVAGKIGSRAMAADSRQTDLCGYLAVVLLAGLVVNAMLGWWWADPGAALLMAGIIAKEGVDALRGRTSCECCSGSA